MIMGSIVCLPVCIVEVDYKVDVMKSHDMVDNIERDVKKSIGNRIGYSYGSNQKR